MMMPEIKLIRIDGEQLVALSINDYSELNRKIGELEGEILGYKLQEKTK
jgi:hypothetical protein